MMDECEEACDTIKYYYSYADFKTNVFSRISLFKLRMHPHAMSILTMTEKKAMTFDVLLANIGGALGLLLGVSCLTVITAIQFIIRKIIKVCRM